MKKKKKKNTQIKILSIIFHLQTEHPFTSDIPFKISASKEARRGRGRCKKCPKATRKHLPRSYHPRGRRLFQGVSSSTFLLLLFFFFFFFFFSFSPSTSTPTATCTKCKQRRHPVVNSFLCFAETTD